MNDIQPTAVARGAVTAAVSLVMLTGAAPTAASSPPVLRQRTAVPAYWAPDTAAGAAMFRRLAQHYPANDMVVVNPDSGPGEAASPAYARAVRSLRDAGALALGYVDTGYFGVAFASQDGPATRPDGPGGGSISVQAWTTQIIHDVDQWHRHYGPAGLAGIFLDRTTAVCGTAEEPDRYLDLYGAVTAHISRWYPDDTIVINPGLPVEPCYAEVADVIVTFEGPAAVYLDPADPRSQPPAWQLASPDAGRFWNLVYDAATPQEMARVVEESRRRNVGYVYVTDDRIVTDGSGAVVDHPWDTLPWYWAAELAMAADNTDRTPPEVPSCLTSTVTTPAAGHAEIAVTVRWAPSHDNVAVAGYDIRRDDGPATTTSDTEWTVTGPQPAARYRFQVRARDVAENASDWSEPLTVRIP